MKNILIKLFQNRIIRVDYREYKVLRYYNDFYFSNFIGKGKLITNDEVIFYIILIENVELSVGDSLL